MNSAHTSMTELPFLLKPSCTNIYSELLNCSAFSKLLTAPKAQMLHIAILFHAVFFFCSPECGLDFLPHSLCYPQYQLSLCWSVCTAFPSTLTPHPWFILSSGRQTMPLRPQGGDMCVMSHFVMSYHGDRSLTVSITMMEVAMKTGGWERGEIQIYP